MAAAAIVATAASSAEAYTVYYDNTETGWTQPKIYYWNPNWTEAQKPSWPGVNMTAYTANPKLSDIWTYEVDDEVTGIIFNNGSTQSKDYMGNKESFADKVFGFAKEGSSTSVSDVILGDIGTYSQEEAETVAWTVHFHNKSSWNNVYVRISGGKDAGGQMSAFLNGAIYDYKFEAPENASLKCSFYSVSDGAESNTTATWKLVNGHVYTESGDKGLNSEYDPVNTLPEKEYWLEPGMPSQLQEATLWFNRAYNPDSKLRNTDEIYIYPGLVSKGGSDTDWFGAPAWADLDAKYKMVRDESNPDLFSITFSPSIASWFGADEDDRFTKLALIFRNKSGSVKQHSDNQFISLKQLADPTAGLGAILSYENAGGTLTVTAEKGKLMLTPVNDQIIKVFTLRNSATVTEERPSISVVDKAFANPSYSVTENDTDITLSISGGIKAHIDKTTCQVSFHDINDNLYLRELSGLVNNPGRIEVSFESMNDAGFYGGGYNGNRTNWDGNTMIMNNTQTGNWGQGTSHPHNICIPFYVSTNGYGVYFDDHYRGATISTTRTGSTYSSGSSNPIAYYFIGGGEIAGGHGSMQTVVENYTGLTGFQELPPYWSLGYITSKFSFASRTEAEAAVNNTKNINIPIDAIVFDIHWQGGVQMMGKIDWDISRYPNPQEMIENFRKGNVHTIAITEPYFTSNCGNYQSMKDNGFFSDDHVNYMEWLQSEHVGLLDVTKREAIKWFKDLYKKRTLEGIDGWWLDLGEPERHDGDSRYELGDVNQVHNEYGNRWCEFALEALKECKPEARHILMPRAGTSGMQRFNAFPWTGDIARTWEGLKAQVPALVSGAMSGVSYLGSDIGGFSADNIGTNADLYRRWVQLGVFYPSMRTHSATRPEVWQPDYSGIRNDVRNAINLRYAYLPYTYTRSYYYTTKGTPIARPANFGDTDPSVLSDCRDAYLWGADIYVAPVLDSSQTKSITFPEGDWLDMNDFKTIYSGHSTYRYDAPVSVLPHFMRRGSFVPRYRQDTFTSTAEIESNRITVHYFPSYGQKTDTGEYYDDDHTSANSIEAGAYLLTRFSATCQDGVNGYIDIHIDREGNGWNNMYDNRPQDILLHVHDYRLGNNNMIKSRSTKAAGEYNTYAEDFSDFSAKRVGSLDEVLAENEAVSFANDGNDLYIRIPNMAATQAHWLRLSSDGVTGVPEVTDPSMALSYANGVITYSASANTDELSLRIYSTTGQTVAEYNGLTADGTASQIGVDLARGVYIARLSGTAAGATSVKTLKMIVM